MRHPPRFRSDNAARAAAGALLPLVLMLAACATGGLDNDADPTAGLQDARVTTRTEANGDVISEYRVAGQLRVVKIVPARGPVYYLVDSNADGRLDSRRGDGPTPVQYKLFGW